MKNTFILTTFALLTGTVSSASAQVATPPAEVITAAQFSEMNQATVLKIQAIRADGQALSAGDAELAQRWAMAGLAQLVASEPAAFKAVTEEVTLLAQAEVVFQNAIAAKLVEIAGNTEFPQKLDDATQVRIDRAKQIEGKSREAVYLSETGVKGHTKLRQVVLEVRSKAVNPALKELAATALPAIDLHLRASQLELNKPR